MSVATGIAPGELLDLEPDLWEAVERAVAERWTTETELAASTVELLSTFLVGWVKANSRRGFRGEPISVPRPRWWQELREARAAAPDAPVSISVGALAELTGKSIEPASEVADGG